MNTYLLSRKKDTKNIDSKVVKTIMKSLHLFHKDLVYLIV